jgi:hypothetical protein
MTSLLYLWICRSAFSIAAAVEISSASGCGSICSAPDAFRTSCAGETAASRLWLQDWLLWPAFLKVAQHHPRLRLHTLGGVSFQIEDFLAYLPSMLNYGALELFDFLHARMVVWKVVPLIVPRFELGIIFLELLAERYQSSVSRLHGAHAATPCRGIVNLVRRGHARAPVAPNIAVTPLFGRRSPHPRL